MTDIIILAVVAGLVIVAVQMSWMSNGINMCQKEKFMQIKTDGNSTMSLS